MDAAEQTGKRKPFTRELEALLNRHSMENGSDTPDWILAEFLHDVLIAWNEAVSKREKWYGRGPHSANSKLMVGRDPEPPQ